MARLYHGKDDLSMAIRSFLAMTAAEFAVSDPIPPHIAWMACHFSPYGSGLSNLPASMPPGSLLILNDRIPIHGHDTERIAAQLQQAVDVMQCCGVLLDFQHPGVKECATLASHLAAELSCPVAVSDLYAQTINCPVFLSPCPHHVPLSEYIMPWKGQELWLDLASDAETITLTKDHSQIVSLPLGEIPENGHADSLLHCHYSIEAGIDSARFTLWRTKEDTAAMAKEAEDLGIHTLVSLFLETK